MPSTQSYRERLRAIASPPPPRAYYCPARLVCEFSGRARDTFAFVEKNKRRNFSIRGSCVAQLTRTISMSMKTILIIRARTCDGSLAAPFPLDAPDASRNFEIKLRREKHDERIPTLRIMRTSPKPTEKNVGRPRSARKRYFDTWIHCRSTVRINVSGDTVIVDSRTCLPREKFTRDIFLIVCPSYIRVAMDRDTPVLRSSLPPLAVSALVLSVFPSLRRHLPETRKRPIRLTYVVARLLLQRSLQSQFWHS